MAPHLSVIVPVRNGERTLVACLEALGRSAGPAMELILVDDASTDATPDIARRAQAQVVTHEAQLGPLAGRWSGQERAQGSILIFIDADILVRADTLRRIADYFAANRGVAAVTGLLSTEHPHSNFASQYKNLYMNFIFKQLPREVRFLYGSIFAVRRDAMPATPPTTSHFGEDTALGQALVAAGRRIHLVRELDVVHLKRYSLGSLLKNDFLIPFSWAGLFLRFRGWRQMNGGGFAHASLGQIGAVILAPALVGLVAAALWDKSWWVSTGMVAATWLILNRRMLIFMARERGAWFGLRALLFTFVDQLVMAAGIAAGFLSAPARGR